MALSPESKREAAAELAPGLYLVATPIGNARDITLRALDVLRTADAIAAEDTRQTRKLMEIHAVALNGRLLIAYHDRNAAKARPRIAALLAEGKSVAYCTDAGTPLVSDPGYRLAELAIDTGVRLVAIPGASAVLTGLSVAGLPSDRFFFAGFLPPKSAARKTALSAIASVPSTLVFYESPRRAAAALADMADVLGGDRPATLCRELTKKFEETRRGSLTELADALAGEPPPRGEVVLLVGPPQASATATAADIDAELLRALETQSVKDSARDVAQRLGLAKRYAYARAVELSKK